VSFGGTVLENPAKSCIEGIIFSWENKLSILMSNLNPEDFLQGKVSKLEIN
jgi:hypothetical protein